MNKPLQFRTNLNCEACVAAVKPFLDGEPGIARWEVDLAKPEKTLTVHGDSVAPERVRAAMDKAGFRVLGEINPAITGPIGAVPPAAPAQPMTYFPLALLVGFLTGTVLLLEVASGLLVIERAMRNFMGGFFLSFSFFKLLDRDGFASTYRMYDIVARRFPAWGHVYPFVELLLGISYVGGFKPFWTNLTTLVVMSVSSIGVIQSLLERKTIRCACLGTVFNLPMSTVTLVEDGLMAAMAAVMLFAGPHDGGPDSDSPRPATHYGEVSMFDHHSHTSHAAVDDRASLMVQPGSIRPAGQPSRLQMMIHEADGAMARDFDIVHEEKVHLIIVRDGLDTFGHIHPEVDARGNLTSTWTFPTGGRYRFFADYQAAGKGPAVASAVVEVDGKNPTAPELVPNVPGQVRGDGLVATVGVETDGHELEARIRFDLRDLQGEPVGDLQPYLGAMGHLVLISEDGESCAHAHPLDPGARDPSSRVAFHVRFLSRGLYKGWGQFKRNGVVQIVPFVMDVT
jgi:copper chaperone CopZ